MIIYKITNILNNKAYIGQTMRNLKTRRAEHLRTALNSPWIKHPTPLHKDIKEFGSASFEWEILEVCTSCDHMNERERFYIKLLNTMTPNGYNQTIGGAVDESMSEGVRNKIADAMIKQHQNPEYRARVYPKLKGKIPPNKGIPMSEEQKAKVGAARAATHKVPGYINPNLGQRRTEEQKERIKEGQQGKMASGEKWYKAHANQYTDEVRAKMSAKKKGKKPANTKQVQCIETGEVFNGLTEASTKMQLNRQSIYLQIKGKLKQVGGKYTFRYLSK